MCSSDLEDAMRIDNRRNDIAAEVVRTVTARCVEAKLFEEKPCRENIDSHRREGVIRIAWNRPGILRLFRRKAGRSEERRVGKEGRSRWSPCS